MSRSLTVPSLWGYRGPVRSVFDELNKMLDVPTMNSGFPVYDQYLDESGNRVLEFALAGYTKEMLELEVKQNCLTVRANKKETSDTDNSRRIAQRSFEHTFYDSQSKFNLDEMCPTFENGLLKIVIPVKEEVKPKRIEIK